jgi:hypothetical protein
MAVKPKKYHREKRLSLDSCRLCLNPERERPALFSG